MPPAEGARLIDEVTAYCTQPRYVYSHHWRDGDAVMWDNRCTLHRATTFDRTQYKRKLHICGQYNLCTSHGYKIERQTL